MINVALTIDVEPYSRLRNDWDRYFCIEKIMPKLLELNEKYDIPYTWFITHDFYSEVDTKFPLLVEEMAKNGEIGCHVHFRDKEGNDVNKPYWKWRYNVTYDFQREVITRATDSLRGKGFNVVSFRGGALFFDENTLKILEELDYKVDSSVQPGLYYEPVEKLIVNHKQCTTTQPYFPSRENHCVPGNSQILEAPLSVYPIVSLKTRVISIYFALPLNIGCITRKPLKAIDKIKRISNSRRDTYIVLNYHPKNFLLNTNEQFKNLERFYVRSKNVKDLKFITLNYIRKNFSKNFDNDKELDTSRFIITLFDFIYRMRKIQRLFKYGW